MEKVLLVNMPFGALERQSLGISLLKAKLSDDGICCDLSYLNYVFAEYVGFDDYKWISSDLPYTAFAGDWLFTQALYGDRPLADENYFREVLFSTWQLNTNDVTRLLNIRERVTSFLDYCLRTVPWSDYTIVGFTSTFEQNIASLALAAILKSCYPSLTIVFGGANWEAEMGMELHRKFPFVDYAFSGEADHSFPSFVTGVFSGATRQAIEQIPGLIFRDEHGQTCFSGKAALVTNMDELPVPDYSEYFGAFYRASFGNRIAPSLLLETSRGCWWGAKNHCTFCGLNGGGMSFRSKRADRVLNEVRELSEKWGVTFFECVDNILDMHYFQDLIPELAKLPEDGGFQFFFEVKANLNRKQIELMHTAGIRHIHPGIESMNNHVLQLMRKGTTALQNIQLLRLCKEYDISAEWNVLYGFPGETQVDYREMLDLFRAIRFLHPPNVCAPIRLDRFSPYYNEPEKFGLKELVPINSVRYLYPFEAESYARISYYFDYSYEDEINPTGFATDVIRYSDDWRKHPDTGQVTASYPAPELLVITDTRAMAALRRVELRDLEKAVFEYCDEIRTIASIRNYLESIYGPLELKDENIIAFLNSLIVNELMVTDNGKYLSLAIGLKPKIVKPERHGEENFSTGSYEVVSVA